MDCKDLGTSDTFYSDTAGWTQRAELTQYSPRTISVSPQTKTGKWKWELADNGWANHICSECGYTENTDIHVSLGWKYCPNCGARMEK